MCPLDGIVFERNADDESDASFLSFGDALRGIAAELGPYESV